MKIFFLSATIAVVSLILNTQHTMSPVWYGPYLSAASNIQIGEPMLVDINEVKHFKDMSVNERERYQFQESSETTDYTNGHIGYIYLIYIAKRIFFVASDQMAIEYLQILVHSLFCSILIVRFPSRRQKLMFLFLYALNPVIIYYTTFPYYYFWQSVPSFTFLFLITISVSDLEHPRLLMIGLVALFLLNGLVILTRPTVIPLVTLIFFLALLKIKKKRFLVAATTATIIMVIMLDAPMQKNFWHTPYIGIGGYINPYGITHLSDNFGYALYEHETGVELVASLGGNLYQEEVMQQWTTLTRSRYLDIAQENPLMLMRNAALNVVQSYSIGYLNGAPAWIHYAVAASGFLVILALLYSGQYLILLAIGIAGIGFSPYYPPIQSYMFGSFVLLAFAAISFIEYMACRYIARRAFA